jgi:hypothetical protein
LWHLNFEGVSGRGSRGFFYLPRPNFGAPVVFPGSGEKGAGKGVVGFRVDKGCRRFLAAFPESVGQLDPKLAVPAGDVSVHNILEIGNQYPYNLETGFSQ